jgi:hypothetical protein
MIARGGNRDLAPNHRAEFERLQETEGAAKGADRPRDRSADY